MSFAVVGYFAFLLIGLVVYYLIPRKFSWIWLLMLSYIYYFTFNIRTSLYMVSTTLFIYFGGLALNKVIDNGNTYLKENKEQLGHQKADQSASRKGQDPGHHHFPDDAPVDVGQPPRRSDTHDRRRLGVGCADRNPG